MREEHQPMGTAPAYVPALAMLRKGEELWDPGTRAVLLDVGLQEGWRCLEIGAGYGSIAVWMAELVGPTGRVVATDRLTDRLIWSKDHGVEVWSHDMTTDALPPAEFDLIHARMFTQLLAEPAHAVSSMVAALRPGGWLVLEDTDTSSLFRTAADGSPLAEVKKAAYRAMRSHGHRETGGLIDVELMLEAGLEDVAGEGRAIVVNSGGSSAEWYALWLGQLWPQIEAAGLLSREQMDAALAWLGDPHNRFLSQAMVAVRGRRRHEG